MKAEDGVKMAEIWLSSDYYDTNVYGLGRIKEFEVTRKKG